MASISFGCEKLTGYDVALSIHTCSIYLLYAKAGFNKINLTKELGLVVPIHIYILKVITEDICTYTYVVTVMYYLFSYFQYQRKKKTKKNIFF
jgi:hypothetical protein